jgi:hypothetical protein
MNKNKIEQEWRKLNFEVLKNKPKIDGPYPSNIVRKRELLLFAQGHLSNIIGAKIKKNKKLEEFNTKLYDITISRYYNWNER